MSTPTKDTPAQKDIYRINFPGYEEEGGSVKPDMMLVESDKELAVLRMVIKHIGITLAPATARDVMEQYESGGSVVSIDEHGNAVIKKHN